MIYWKWAHHACISSIWSFCLIERGAACFKCDFLFDFNGRWTGMSSTLLGIETIEQKHWLFFFHLGFIWRWWMGATLFTVKKWAEIRLGILLGFIWRRATNRNGSTLLFIKTIRINTTCILFGIYLEVPLQFQNTSKVMHLLTWLEGVQHNAKASVNNEIGIWNLWW